MFTSVELEQVKQALDLASGNKAEAARILDKHVNWVKRRARAMVDLMDSSGIEVPEFQSEYLPIDQRLAMRCEQFAKKKASFDEHTWFPVTVKDNAPIGVLAFGDPHLDDDGCNIPLLMRHAEIAAETPGIYGINIGDVTNNWQGPLQRLHAKQGVSMRESLDYVEWFLLESGIPWMLWLLGNHDQWGQGGEIIEQMMKRYDTNKMVCHSWEARFRLIFRNANDYEFRVNASHDFPGHSRFNPLHALMREEMEGADADVLIAGHRHIFAAGHYENPKRGRVTHMCRIRGYKYMDDHARNLGYKEQNEGASALIIFNPWSKLPTSRVSIWYDIEEGADYLTFLRSKDR